MTTVGFFPARITHGQLGMPSPRCDVLTVTAIPRTHLPIFFRTVEDRGGFLLPAFLHNYSLISASLRFAIAVLQQLGRV